MQQSFRLKLTTIQTVNLRNCAFNNSIFAYEDQNANIIDSINTLYK